ncbi:MAG TPA: hypothetical protein VJI46_05835 [Candidatus Nanoarchaeia archaeon]|nr:hypothetical protein [Candidatus Nanoarchaeia archaeon]
MVDFNALLECFKVQDKDSDRLALEKGVGEFFSSLSKGTEDYFSERGGELSLIEKLQKERAELNVDTSRNLEMEKNMLEIKVNLFRLESLAAIKKDEREKMEKQRRELNGSIEDFKKRAEAYNKEIDLSREIESLSSRISDGLIDLGILVTYFDTCNIDGYSRIETFPGPGANGLNRMLLKVYGTRIGESIGVFLKSSQQMIERLSNSKKLARMEEEYLENAVYAALGEVFKGVYLCPALAPGEFDFRKRGEWTYVDISKLNSPENKKGIRKYFLDVNPSSTFVQFDVAMQELHPELPEGFFDLVYYALDYAGGGATPRCAARLAKKDGLVLTGETPERLPDGTGLRLLKAYSYFGFYMYTKSLTGNLPENNQQRI